MKFIFRINRIILLILAAGLPLAIILFPENSISWESQGIIFIGGRSVYLFWLISIFWLFTQRTWLNILSAFYVIIYPIVFGFIAFPNSQLHFNYSSSAALPEFNPLVIICFQIIWMFLYIRTLVVLYKNAPKQLGNIIPLVLFYPIGIWVLHPRIQKYLKQPKENS